MTETIVASEMLKVQLRQKLSQLSGQQLIEVLRFIDYLKYRDQTQETPGEFVTLGGLWKDVPFDITDDEVRSLRQQMTQNTSRKTG